VQKGVAAARRLARSASSCCRVFPSRARPRAAGWPPVRSRLLCWRSAVVCWRPAAGAVAFAQRMADRKMRTCACSCMHACMLFRGVACRHAHFFQGQLLRHAATQPAQGGKRALHPARVLGVT
jgi:hypothetical protein